MTAEPQEESVEFLMEKCRISMRIVPNFNEKSAEFPESMCRERVRKGGFAVTEGTFPKGADAAQSSNTNLGDTSQPTAVLKSHNPKLGASPSIEVPMSSTRSGERE